MELKQPRRILLLSRRQLLIVPYGIETLHALAQGTFGGLLIVPYGIETLSNKGNFVCVHLLIVPYGIETKIIRN